MASKISGDTYLGRFWLPDKGEEGAVEGSMVLDSDGAYVLLRDVLDENPLDDSVVFARLQGRYAKATLFNCYGSWTRDGAGAVVQSRVSSTLVALGCAKKEVGGKALGYRIPGSEVWLDDPCFHLHRGSDGKSSISLNHWEKHEYSLIAGVSLERFYAASFPGKTNGVERYTIIREMSYRNCSKRRLSLDDHWGLMVDLKRFFEFMTQRCLSYESIQLYDAAPIDSYEPDVSVHHIGPSISTREAINRDDFLIHAHEIRSKIEDLIWNWMALMANHPAPLLHYFHAFDRQRRDRVLHFVWNAAALEELHKMRFGRDKLTLFERLKAMRERWALAFNRLPSDDVLKHIKISRHYHAHAAGDLRGKAATEWLLYRYGDFLMALSNLEILTLLGLTQDEAIHFTRHNRVMKESLELTRYPGATN